MIIEETKKVVEKWMDKLHLDKSFNITLEFISDNSIFNTGHFKVDVDTNDVTIFIKTSDLNNSDIERLIIRDLLYLKLYPLDITTHELIEKYYQIDSVSYDEISLKYSLEQDLVINDLVDAFIFNEEKRIINNNKISPNILLEELKEFDINEIE